MWLLSSVIIKFSNWKPPKTVYCCNGEIPADYEVKELNEGPKTQDNNIKVTSIDIYSVKVKLSIQIISILFKSEILGTI